MAASLGVVELSPDEYQPRPGDDLPDPTLVDNLDDDLLASFNNNTLYGTNDVSVDTLWPSGDELHSPPAERPEEPMPFTSVVP